MLLKDKNVLITGGARGIGRATAVKAADEGANIVLVDINPDVEAVAELIRKNGGKALSDVFDISDPEQVNEHMAVICQKWGDIEVLVNNAGIVNNIAPFTKMTYEKWTWEISVNLTGAFNMIKAVIEPMIQKQWGRIINFSSLGATGGLHFQCGYAASKAGLLGLTKTIALEQAGNGITCNAVLPGLIETELVSKMPEIIRDNALKSIPARRLGVMDEVANLVCFLASDNAAYINGEEISIDGGMRLNVNTLGSQKEVKSRQTGKPKE